MRPKDDEVQSRWLLRAFEVRVGCRVKLGPEKQGVESGKEGGQEKEKEEMGMKESSED